MSTQLAVKAFLIYDIFSSHLVYWGITPLLVDESVHFAKIHMSTVLINHRLFFPSHVLGSITRLLGFLGNLLRVVFVFSLFETD